MRCNLSVWAIFCKIPWTPLSSKVSLQTPAWSWGHTFTHFCWHWIFKVEQAGFHHDKTSCVSFGTARFSSADEQIRVCQKWSRALPPQRRSPDPGEERRPSHHHWRYDPCPAPYVRQRTALKTPLWGSNIFAILSMLVVGVHVPVRLWRCAWAECSSALCPSPSVDFQAWQINFI